SSSNPRRFSPTLLQRQREQRRAHLRIRQIHEENLVEPPFAQHFRRQHGYVLGSGNGLPSNSPSPMLCDTTAASVGVTSTFPTLDLIPIRARCRVLRQARATHIIGTSHGQASSFHS